MDALKIKYPDISIPLYVMEELEKYEGMIMRIDQKDIIQNRNVILSCVIHIRSQNAAVGEGEDLGELLKNYKKNSGMESIEIGSLYRYEPQFISEEHAKGTRITDMSLQSGGYEEIFIYMSTDGQVWICDWDKDIVYRAGESISHFITRRPIDHYNYNYLDSFNYE